MTILNHEPVTLDCTIFEGVKSDLLLTLSHGNVSESLIMRSLTILGTNTLDIGCGVNTREEDEEGGLTDSHLFVTDLHVE